MASKPFDTISAREARQIALAAQGFRARPEKAPSPGKLLKSIDELGVVQIDSVNVVSRTHYMPLFSRLGAYARPDLEALAWGTKPSVFEYWGHEASLLPLALYPFFRWRMQEARVGEGVWKGVAKFLKEQKPTLVHALDEIKIRGPLSASDLQVGDKGAGGWWGWSDAKRAMECLFWAGEVAVATRRNSFERVYDLPERVIPRALVDTAAPSKEDSLRELVRRSAKALGVATGRDLRDYYRLGVKSTALAVEQLVEQGDILPVRVEGWKDLAYLSREAPRPRRCDIHALLSPFDNAIWHRDRTERMFGVRVVLEIYTPAPKRVFGYYVLPFLEDEALTARVDLKADRKASILVVQASHSEPSLTRDTPDRLARELRSMAQWLGLASIEVRDRGNLAPRLAAALNAPA